MGDVVWLTLDPTQAHEQRGRRPALVLTPRLYNAKASLAVICPVTNQLKGYPFEVPIGGDPSLTGVVLVDQVKSLDWLTRRADFMGRVDRPTLDAVRALLKTLLQTS
jgi:mRNA interferase MazF